MDSLQDVLHRIDCDLHPLDYELYVYVHDVISVAADCIVELKAKYTETKTTLTELLEGSNAVETMIDENEELKEQLEAIREIVTKTHALEIKQSARNAIMKCLERVMSKVIEDIANERIRQMGQEGWTHHHDDAHANRELAKAAACYAVGNSVGWPWAKHWWKPKTYRENLVRAGALIAAEIERIDRKALKQKESDDG